MYLCYDHVLCGTMRSAVSWRSYGGSKSKELFSLLVQQCHCTYRVKTFLSRQAAFLILFKYSINCTSSALYP